LVADHASTEAGSETLEPEARAEEAFALLIRLRSGVPIAGAAIEIASDLAAGGLLDAAALPERAVLTRTGRFMAADITARLLLRGACLEAPAAAGTQ